MNHKRGGNGRAYGLAGGKGTWGRVLSSVEVRIIFIHHISFVTLPIQPPLPKHLYTMASSFYC